MVHLEWCEKQYTVYRMERKDIRLTSTSFVVLGLIDYLGPSTPYDLKRSIEQSVENFWPVPHTTFYAEPARLAAAGYLSERQERGGRRRKVYSPTERGTEALREWLQTGHASPPELRDEAMLMIFFGADPAPILRERLGWHRAKLAELEGYLEKVRESGGPAGVERSLVAGTTYHRQLIEMQTAYLAAAEERDGDASPGTHGRAA